MARFDPSDKSSAAYRSAKAFNAQTFGTRLPSLPTQWRRLLRLGPDVVGAAGRGVGLELLARRLDGGPSHACDNCFFDLSVPVVPVMLASATLVGHLQRR